VKLLIGTTDGVFVTGESAGPSQVEGMADRNVRTLRGSNGNIYAGGDDGMFRSTDGGRSWTSSGLEGTIVWDVAVAPGDDRTVYAGTQPAALYRSRDGGETWTEFEAIQRVPGADRWCFPESSLGARARTIVLDPANPERFWLGLEVGGVLSTTDDGASWSCIQPGDDPDIHTMVALPGNADVLYAVTGYGRPADEPLPLLERMAGAFGSKNGGKSWEYLWAEVQPRWTRPLAIDPNPPHAVTTSASPLPRSSFRDPEGAGAVLYQSVDGGASWHSLGDAEHSPSPVQLVVIAPAPQGSGSVLVGTDNGEVWKVTSSAEWTRLASGLPMVQALLPLE
jgi:BNR/Asp-box repeat